MQDFCCIAHSLFSALVTQLSTPQPPLLLSSDSKTSGPQTTSIPKLAQAIAMAKARSLSIFLAAMLVASCFCAAQGAITGTILAKTLLQVLPDAGTAIRTTLNPRTVVSVMCRTRSDIVFDDPWWLKVSVPATGMSGWVVDYYVDCGIVGNCNVAQC